MSSPVKFKPSVTVYTSAAAALLGALAMGFALGFPDPASLTLVVEDDTDTCGKNQSSVLAINQTENRTADTLRITKFQNGWNGGIMPLAALFGAMAGGPVADNFGRRMTLITIGIPFSSGWLLMAFSTNIYMLLAGRAITGFFTGCVCSVVPAYIVEISTPEVRGCLGTFFQILITVGYFVTSLFGIFATPQFNHFFKWSYIAVIGIFPSALMSLAMFFVPESPTWLLLRSSKGIEKAGLELDRLRTASSDKGEELDQLAQSKAKQQSSFSCGDFKKANVWKPLVLACGLSFFQQFSGINAVMFYLVQIFNAAGLGDFKAHASCGVKFVQVLATVASCFLIDRLGRKKLLIASAIGHAVSLSLFIVYYLTLFQECPTSVNFFVKVVPVFCVLVYIVAFSIGYGPVPWLMIAELTPGFARGAVGGIATVFNWTSAAIVGSSYPTLEHYVKPYGAFAIFAAICLASIGFTVLFLPETKGKTLEEIEQAFLGTTAVAQPKRSKEEVVEKL